MENTVFSQWLKVNLDFLQMTFVPQISPAYAQLAVNTFVDKLKLTADVLMDENPDNKAQLVEVWSNYSNDPKVLQALSLAIDDLVATVTDPTVKSGLVLVKDELILTLVALTDADKMNGEQIAKIWKDFLKTDKFTGFIVVNAVLLLEKLKLPNWVISIINALRGTK